MCQNTIYAYVKYNKDQTSREISKGTGIRQTNVTRMLSKLVESGFIDNDHNRRPKYRVIK